MLKYRWFRWYYTFRSNALRWIKTNYSHFTSTLSQLRSGNGIGTG